MMRWLGASLVCVAIAAIGGTENVSSSHIRPGGGAMPVVEAASSGARARVKATLQVGGNESNTFVNLEGSDKLVAESEGTKKTMEEIDDGEYEAVFNKAEEGTVFTVSLERDEDKNAKNNSG